MTNELQRTYSENKYYLQVIARTNLGRSLSQDDRQTEAVSFHLRQNFPNRLTSFSAAYCCESNDRRICKCSNLCIIPSSTSILEFSRVLEKANFTMTCRSIIYRRAICHPQFVVQHKKAKYQVYSTRIDNVFIAANSLCLVRESKVYNPTSR